MSPSNGHPGIGPAAPADLAEVNRIVDAAVMGWSLPERVKRLALPSYRYRESDLDHLQLLVARDSDGRPVGVAALEPPAAGSARLHGLYVHPLVQRAGTGSLLLRRACQRAAAQGASRLTVKAQREAEGFFLAHGFSPVDRDAPHPRRLRRDI